MSVEETSEYSAGWEWATEHGPLLSELFTGQDVSTPELRIRLFREAARRWPSSHDDLVNDLKQTAFVIGAMKAAAQTVPMSRDAASALFEAALLANVMWSTEIGKSEALEILRAKPAGWWRKKMGEASPNDVLNALSVAWRHDWAKERGRRDPRSKWEILIDTMGPRELWALIDATQILVKEDGRPRYVIDSPEMNVEIISRSVYEGGQMVRYAGEIVG